LRKVSPYEGYDLLQFEIPYSCNADCYDRYLLRVEELFQSNKIMLQILNSLPLGHVKASSHNITPPSKSESKSSIQGLIYHFMFFCNKLILKQGEVYIGIEAPKGEFGVFLISEGNVIPYRCKIRSPGYFHLQSISYLSKRLFLADIVTIIGSLDIVFGEIDR